MSVPGKARRPDRTRTSKRFCQEKLCCPSEHTEAVLYCEQCNSLQCVRCEDKLHNDNDVKYHFHDRRKIEQPPDEQLCQIAKFSSNVACKDKNYADIRCEDCKFNYCFDCNELVHSVNSKRKSHVRLSFKDFRNRNKELYDAFASPIKPLSPIDLNDDSLTYVSLPQEIGESMNDMSFTSAHSDQSHHSIPDVCMDVNGPMDLNLLEDSMMEPEDTSLFKDCRSFCLADEHETLKVLEEIEFKEKVGCEEGIAVKVVSIFGNTGDGKSFTLNHTFFGGKEVFKTSALQASCTVGVFAAYDPVNKSLIVDTEGLLGVASNENQRTRQLLKVMAISDVVIYRTRAERLHNDLFYFLSNASKSYMHHFKQELEAATKRCKMNLTLSNLGPAVVIFHETQYTDVLAQDTERILRQRFRDLDCNLDAFCDLKYVGTRTVTAPTDFTQLKVVVKDQLENNSIRAPRKPEVIFQALKVLNDKFSGDIEKSVPDSFPDQYFTCSSCCQSCGVRCVNTMNHLLDKIEHQTLPGTPCKYQHQFDNKIYLCKHCYLTGKKHVVVPKTSSSSDSSWVGLVKYVWSGFVLECPSCGIIYRSHQYWYGNKEVEAAVHVEVRHVWPGSSLVLQGTHNAARKLLDSLHLVADTVSSVSSKPTKAVSHWVADQIAPDYWVPNARLTNCHSCNKVFADNDQKHHCRGCGQGFCDECSSQKRPVPERGWGHAPVRVCMTCYEPNKMTDSNTSTGSESQVTARKVGEAVTCTLGAVASAIDYPLGILKDSARPVYWIPDEEITNCYVCAAEFGPKLAIHHCRACGQGVCVNCSPHKQAVPLRGWDYPVRVCTKCVAKKDRL